MIEDVDLEIAFEPYSDGYDKPISKIFPFVQRAED